jgi:hypothetical protein
MKRWSLILGIYAYVGLSLAAAAPAETLAETLERGIYKEETEGDLAGAIEIYRRVVAESQQARALAAQAQFRIGQCLLKQERPEQAAEAFRQLIEQYPEQKELIAQARKHLPAGTDQLSIEGLQPVWETGERLILELRLAGGQMIGLVGTRIVEAQRDDMETWQMFVRTFIIGGLNQGASFVEVSRSTNRPLRARMLHTLIGHSETRYEAEQIVIRKLPPTVETPEEQTVPLDSAHQLAVANDQCYYLFRQLPLTVGYQAMLPIRDGMSGGSPINVKLEVPKKETLEVPFGKFDCFRVELNIGQTFWIADTPQRHLVKFDAGGATGVLVHVLDDAPQVVRDTGSGLSVTVPPTWFAHVEQGEAGDHPIWLVDSAHLTSGALLMRPKTNLEATNVDSLEAWADRNETRLKAQLGNLTRRADGQTATRLAGVQALRRVYDGTISKHEFVVCDYWALTDDRAVQLSVMVPKETYDEALPEVEAIRESVKVE